MKLMFSSACEGVAMAALPGAEWLQMQMRSVDGLSKLCAHVLCTHLRQPVAKQTLLADVR